MSESAVARLDFGRSPIERQVAGVPTGGERYFARPPVQAGIQVPHSVLDRAVEISPLRRGTAARLAAEPVCLRQDRRRLPPGCRPSTHAEMVLSKPMLRTGLLGALRLLSGTELVEFRRTVDAATWVRNVRANRAAHALMPPFRRMNLGQGLGIRQVRRCIPNEA
jgi:hypothetical protein